MIAPSAPEPPTLAPVEGHLSYYLRHGLNPVCYEMADLERHLQRRASLYRALGLSALSIRDRRVLEVAPGSGQNSLYIAALQPRELVLIEPNPVAVRDIQQHYSRCELPLSQPRLYESKFEDYLPNSQFDVVLCENWLGSSLHERSLLKRLAALTAEDGVLVVTTVSPVGILPNVLRRALAVRLTNNQGDFATRTCTLVAAFAPHLATLHGMTRTPIDWVQDNMLNPAYFGLCLTIPMVM